MALPSEILIDVFSFIGNFSMASVALCCARFLKLVSENSRRLPVVREFFFQCIHPGLVLLEGASSGQDEEARYSCGIELDRSSAEACREAFRVAASVAGKHVIAGVYFWYVDDLPIQVEEIFDLLPSLRFAEKLELNDDDVRAAYDIEFEEFDAVKFAEQFPRLKRLQMGTVKADREWTFLRQPAFLKLSELSVNAAISEDPDAEDEVLRFCFDFSLLEHGQRKTVMLPSWEIPRATMDKLIQSVGTCERRMLIALKSWHCRGISDTFVYTTRSTSLLKNVTVFLENSGCVTVTNDAETIAMKSALVDNPKNFFAIF